MPEVATTAVAAATNPTLALISGGISLAQLLAGIFTKPRIPPELKSVWGELEETARVGLTPEQEQNLFAAGSRRISPVVSSIQRRGAAVAAEGGISGGSAGRDISVGAAQRAEAELFGQLESTITQADIGVMERARAALPGAIGLQESILQPQRAARGQLIGGGIAGLQGGLEDYLTRNDPSQIENFFQLLQQYFGTKQDYGGMLDVFKSLGLLDFNMQNPAGV